MYKKALILMWFLATTLLLSTVSAYSKAEFVKVIPVLEKNLGDAQSDFNNKCDNGLWKAYRKLNSCFEDMCDKWGNALSDSSTAVYNLNYIVWTISSEEDNDLLKRANSFYVIADDSIIDTKKIISKIDYKQCTNNSYTTGDFWNPSTTTWNYSNTTSSNNNWTYSNNTVTSSNETIDSPVNEPVVNNDYTVATDYESTSSKAWYKPTTWFNDEQEQREVDNADDKDDIDSLKAQLHNIDDLEVTDPGDQLINSSDYDEDWYRAATADEKRAEKARIIAEINQKEVDISNRSSDIQRNTSALNEYSSNVSKAESDAGESLVKRNQLNSVKEEIERLETSIEQKEAIIPDSTTSDEEKALASLKAQQKNIESSFTAEDYKALTKVDAAQSELDRATELVDDWKVLKTQADRDHEAIQQTARDAIKYNSENNINWTTKTSPWKTTWGKNTIPSTTNEKGGNDEAKLDWVKKANLKISNYEKSQKALNDKKAEFIEKNQSGKCNEWSDCAKKYKKEIAELDKKNWSNFTEVKNDPIANANNSLSSTLWAANILQEEADKEKDKEQVDFDKFEKSQNARLKNIKKLMNDACWSNIDSNDCKVLSSNYESTKNDADRLINNNNNNKAKKEFEGDSKLTEEQKKEILKDPKKVKEYLEKKLSEKKTAIQSKVDKENSMAINEAKQNVVNAENEVYEGMTNENNDPATIAKWLSWLANNKQLVANRAKTNANKVCSKSPKSTECTAAKAKATWLQDKANTAASESNANLAGIEMDAKEAEANPALAKQVANAAKKEAQKACAWWASSACDKAKEKAKKAEDAYKWTTAAKSDITKSVFTISVNDITPGMKVHGGDIEENVNFALGTIIQKLMIGLGSLSILIMTVWAWYIVLHNGQDELLNKWKSIFMSWIYAMMVALSSYYLIVIVRYVLYH